MGQMLCVPVNVPHPLHDRDAKKTSRAKNIADGGSTLVGGLGALIGLDVNDTERTVRRLFARSLFAPTPSLSTSSTMATALALPQSRIWLYVALYSLARAVRYCSTRASQVQVPYHVKTVHLGHTTLPAWTLSPVQRYLSFRHRFPL